MAEAKVCLCAAQCEEIWQHAIEKLRDTVYVADMQMVSENECFWNDRADNEVRKQGTETEDTEETDENRDSNRGLLS